MAPSRQSSSWNWRCLQSPKRVVMQSATDRSSLVERIVIVGGGTAGWVAGVDMNRYLRRLNGKVVLVEPPTLGTIGVGEATIPSLVNFVRMLNLDEKEFMRRGSA